MYNISYGKSISFEKSMGPYDIEVISFFAKVGKSLIASIINSCVEIAISFSLYFF